MSLPDIDFDTPSLPPGVNPWRARIILLSLAHTVGTSCYLSIMAMGPVIRDDLGISATEFGFFMSAVFGAQLISAMPSGAITDRLGVGWTLSGSMIIMMIIDPDSVHPTPSRSVIAPLGIAEINCAPNTADIKKPNSVAEIPKSSRMTGPIAIIDR